MILGRFCLSCNFPIYYRATWSGAHFSYRFFRIREGQYQSVASCPWCGIYLSMAVLTGGSLVPTQNTHSLPERQDRYRYFPEWRPDENKVDRAAQSVHPNDSRHVSVATDPKHRLLEE